MGRSEAAVVLTGNDINLNLIPKYEKATSNTKSRSQRSA
jgi:hypothetical protein